jgi:hypothetical protein
MKEQRMKDWKSALVYSLCFLAVAAIASLTFFNRSKADDIINVTGLGTMDFSSDRIAWKASFSESSRDLVKSYEMLNAAKIKVLVYLKDSGVTQSELAFDPIAMDKLYRDVRNKDGEVVGQEFVAYRLTQGFKLDSSEVDKVEGISRNVTSLIKQGVEIESGSPDYFYAALSDLKLRLIAMATQDAKIRAQAIAANSGATLGKLRYANMGVFQIIGLNSSPEASWEGSFDTKSKMKTASITVREQFAVR